MNFNSKYSKLPSKIIDLNTHATHNTRNNHNSYNIPDSYNRINSHNRDNKRVIHKGGEISCNKGEKIRTGYTTKISKNVKSNNVTTLSSTGKKTSEDIKKYIQSREKTQINTNKKLSKDISTKCPKGYIMRDSHKNDSYKPHSKKNNVINIDEKSTVAQCVKKQTAKSEKRENIIVIMEKDLLANYGYIHVKSLSIRERKTALKKAIKDIKPLSVYRRLLAISTLNKNKDRDLAIILKEDSEWIKTQHEYIVGKHTSKTINSKLSKKSENSKNSKLPTLSKLSKNSKISKVSVVSKVSKNSKNSKVSKKSKNSKLTQNSKSTQKSKKNQHEGKITDKYSTGYIPNRDLIKYNVKKSNSQNWEGTKSNSKLSLSKKNKLFYYKDNLQ